MENSSIILDLDYTIFPTNTINRKVVEPFFDDLSINLKNLFSKETIENIHIDLWKDSWDVVIEKYKIPKEVFLKSVKILENLELKLEISTYSDYQIMKDYKIDKFLVTTGLTSLQNLKIEALNIRYDFKEIIINDRLIETKTKLDIFTELITKYKLLPERTFVIGDNPNSEIQAGNELKLKTIQILRENIIKGENAEFYINSFSELKKIIT
jgi:putative hydrolase of the HAD superfamily